MKLELRLKTRVNQARVFWTYSIAFCFTDSICFSSPRGFSNSRYFLNKNCKSRQGSIHEWGPARKENIYAKWSPSTANNTYFHLFRRKTQANCPLKKCTNHIHISEFNFLSIWHQDVRYVQWNNFVNYDIKIKMIRSLFDSSQNSNQGYPSYFQTIRIQILDTLVLAGNCSINVSSPAFYHQKDVEVLSMAFT